MKVSPDKVIELLDDWKWRACNQDIALLKIEQVDDTHWLVTVEQLDEGR
jgi:hypothetical protein